MGTVLLFLACVNLLPVCTGQTPTTNCPRYVDEGSQLVCTCRPSSGVKQATLTWPGHSDTSQLVIGNVRRQDNGTQYVCQMVVNGQTTTSTYTLQVAYGPSDNTLDISGQSPFPTDGSRSLTLTCRDRDSYPTPTYSWTSVTCDNGNTGSTCTFTPRVPNDDGKVVICRAQNTGGSDARLASKGFTVSLQFTVVPEDTPMAVIVGGVVGGILVLATVAAVVGVLIWKKRNPRYEKPLPRRERESDAYTGLQPPNNDTSRQPPAGIANPHHPTGLDESDRPHSYMEVLPPDNTYDPLQMTRRQDTAVYTELRPTGSGGRGTDADGYELPVLPRRH